MDKINKIISFDKENKTITVQAGITWRTIQEYIDPFNYSLAGIQSYSDFSVGRSIAVNCHGRDITGSIEESIIDITMICTNGEYITVSRDKNRTIFQGILGGYGLLGVIINVTLQLIPNDLLVKETVLMPLESYPDYFKTMILENPNVSLHNATAYLIKNRLILSTTFFKNKNNQMVSNTKMSNRLRKKKKWHFVKQILQTALTLIPSLHEIKPYYESKNVFKKNKIYFRNYEMSYSVNSLNKIIKSSSIEILQEYFIPCKDIINFINRLEEIKNRYQINIINISIRFVRAQKESILAYAQEDSFSCVLYINIKNKDTIEEINCWTQKIIDAALKYNGRYYLPYQLSATQTQFNKAYPNHIAFLNIKNKIDPNHIFQNMLYKKYMNYLTEIA